MKNVYKRACKPLYAPVPVYQPIEKPELKKNSIISVHFSTECHVTPDQLSHELVNFAIDAGANIDSGYWCDPQAGTGQLINAMLVAGVSNVVAIEREYSLVNCLMDRFECNVDIRHIDCFDLPLKVDVIIANHPFKKVKSFFMDAISKLNDGGIYVGIVPKSFEYDGTIKLLDLGFDTFETAKVLTKVILFKKTE